MKANTVIGPGGRTGKKKEEITVDPILSGIVRVSRSDDGNSICFTDYSSKSIRVQLPSERSVEGGINRDVTLLSYRSNKCRCGCGCVYDHFCGMTVLINPRTGQLCNHH
jgi:hypothetical protein